MHIQSSFAEYFFTSRHALKTARKNKKIYSEISKFNMTYTEIDSGLAKLEKLMDADKKKIELHGKQLEARVAFKSIYAKVNTLYMSHVGLMKVKFRKNPERVERLMLNVPRERSINGWLQQADTFYVNLINDADMVSKLTQNAISPDKLTEAHAGIKEVECAKNNYREAIGLSQAAVETRDALFEEFDLWMKEFIYICKMALNQESQLLEALKIKVFSKGYIKHKPTSFPAAHAPKS
jgi:hypothetical protein